MDPPAKSRAAVPEMCLGSLGRIVELVDHEHQIATIEIEDRQQRVNVGLLPEPPQPGDWVLVHLGFAVETLEAEQAAATVALLRELEPRVQEVTR